MTTHRHGEEIFTSNPEDQKQRGNTIQSLGKWATETVPGRITTVATGLGVIGGIALGIAPKGNGEQSTQPVAVETLEPTAQPVEPESTIETPEPTATPTETAPETPSIDFSPEVIAYGELTDVEFEKLSKDKQREWWDYISQYIDAYAAGYYEYSQNPSDIMPSHISSENTPEEITTIVVYQMRYVLALEPELREKALIAITMDGRGSSLYRYWHDRVQESGVAIANPKVLAYNGTYNMPIAPAYITDFKSEGEYNYRRLGATEERAANMYFIPADSSKGGYKDNWYV